MLKLLRKYNKQMLAVFMAGLLVVWLGGSALQSLLTPDRGSLLVANTNLGEIHEGDRLKASFETNLLERLRIPWRRPNLGQVRTPAIGIIEWVLLTREAEKCGMRVHPFEVESFLGALGETPEVVARIAAREDIKIANIHEAVRKFLMVRRLATLAMTAPTQSEARLRSLAFEEFETVRVNMVLMHASTLVDPDETFTEKEIESHYQQFKDTQRGRGLNFGYFQPPRVKVEYFRIDRNKVAENLHMRDSVLESRARTFWHENPNDPAFQRDEPTDSEGETAEPDSAAEPSAEDSGDDTSDRKSWGDARDAAIDRVRVQIARERDMPQMTEWLIQELQEPWFDTEVGDDGYRIAPEEVLHDGYYESVLGRMPERFQYGGAVSIGRTDFFSQRQAYSLPDIGPAAMYAGGTHTTTFFSRVAFQVQGIATIPEVRGVDTSLYLAVGQSVTVPFNDLKSNSYVFRVIDVKPAAPPDSVEEVREEVIADLRMRSAFNRAIDEANRFEMSITGDGMKAAYDADPGLNVLLEYPSGYFSPPAFGRARKGSATWGPTANRSPRVLGIQLSDGFVERCFGLEDQPPGERHAVIAGEEEAVVAVVEFVAREPIRTDEYAEQRDSVLAQLNRRAVDEAIDQWLDPERIRGRNGFTPAQQ